MTVMHFEVTDELRNMMKRVEEAHAKAMAETAAYVMGQLPGSCECDVLPLSEPRPVHCEFCGGHGTVVLSCELNWNAADGHPILMAGTRCSRCKVFQRREWPDVAKSIRSASPREKQHGPTCQREGCDRPAKTRGHCASHYQTMRYREKRGIPP